MPIDLSQTQGLQPRARGTANLSVKADSTGKTRLANLRQSGSTKLVFPTARAQDAEVILVNTAGGITGGDRYELNINVQTGAELTLTTQAAERAYRAQRGEVGRVQTSLRVARQAHLNWLPQELILFDNCALARDLSVDLESDASFLMVEPLVFGRAAMHETLSEIAFQDRIKITRNGAPIYIDGVDLNGAATAHLARPAIANGAGAMASVVFVSPEAEHQIKSVRAMLPQSAGASLLAPDIIVLRLLAHDSFELRRSLIPILEHLKQTPLPTSWRL